MTMSEIPEEPPNTEASTPPSINLSNAQSPRPQVPVAKPVAEPAKGDQEEQLRLELKKWSWGGFFLTWIWGIGNRTFVSLLALLPFLTVIIAIVLGFKGNAWAWKNKQWESLEHFRKTQRKWAKWGTIVVILFIVMFVLIFVGVFVAIKNSQPYKTSLEIMQSNSQVTNALGEPITPSILVSGNIEVNGAGGSADLSYVLKGTRDSGTVYVKAKREANVWNYQLIGIEIGEEKRQLNFTSQARTSGFKAPIADTSQVQQVSKTSAFSSKSGVKTIRLKNGNSVRGTIVREAGTKIEVLTDNYGSVIFSRNEIASIED